MNSDGKNTLCRSNKIGCLKCECSYSRLSRIARNHSSRSVERKANRKLSREDGECERITLYLRCDGKRIVSSNHIRRIGVVIVGRYCENGKGYCSIDRSSSIRSSNANCLRMNCLCWSSTYYSRKFIQS